MTIMVKKSRLYQPFWAWRDRAICNTSASCPSLLRLASFPWNNDKRKRRRKEGRWAINFLGTASIKYYIVFLCIITYTIFAIGNLVGSRRREHCQLSCLRLLFFFFCKKFVSLQTDGCYFFVSVFAVCLFAFLQIVSFWKSSRRNFLSRVDRHDDIGRSFSSRIVQRVGTDHLLVVGLIGSNRVLPTCRFDDSTCGENART